MQVEGISALVTGAASGLGAATARALADAGAQVVGLDLAAGWERAGDPPNGVTAVTGDVTSADDVAAAVTVAIDTGAPLRDRGELRRSRLGRPDPVRARASTTSSCSARWSTINLIGTFNVLRLAAEQMSTTEPVDEAGQRGVIVNTASVAAFDGQIGQIAYSASKGGVAGMTLPAARDLAQFGIRVMTIAPGILDTPMMASITEEFRTNLKATVPFPARFGRPDEYAALVLSIAAQDYLNGEVIRLDGALRMAPR